MYYNHMLLRVLLVCCLLALGAHGQGLRILSTYLNAFVINGKFQQNATITVQCTDADYGVYRYITITQSDGTARLLGVRCNAPTYMYTKTQIGVVPNDGFLQLYGNCLLQSPFQQGLNIPEVDFSRSPANPGQIVLQSHHKRRLAQAHGRVQHHRKGFEWILNAVSAGLYCTFAGCGGNDVDLTELTNRVNTLENAGKNLSSSVETMAKELSSLFTAQKNFSATTTAALKDIQDLTKQQIDRAINDVNIQANTTNYLRTLNSQLTKEFGDFQVNLLGTQTQVSSLNAQLLSGFNLTSGNIARVVYDQNLINGNLSLRINDVANTSTKYLAYLRGKVDRITAKMQQQINQLNNFVRNIQARRAEAKWVHSVLQPTIDAGYTPFLLNLGVPPSADTDELVWKLNVETTRILYIRNNAGLTAQMVDLAWYCNTQKLLDFGSSVSSFSDVLRRFGPANCNSSVPQACECWAASQRYSCATSAAAINASNWLNSTDLRLSTVCNGSAVTTGALTVHTTLDSLFLLWGSVCSDGTYNNGDLRVLSGLTGLGASIPYNPAVCVPILDQIIDVSITGQNFIYASLFYMQLAFSRVYVSADYYARFIYGVVPDGITSREDPLAVVNGSDARCFYNAFMSFDTGTHPMLPVYKIQFVQEITSVTTTLDNVTAQTVTQVTASVPNDIVLPRSDSIVVGDPADPSAIWNIPDTDLSVSVTPEGRCGHVTYPMVDFATNFTQYKWEVGNKRQFDHFCGANVASYYRRTLNVQGKCTGSALIGEGGWCTTRNSFSISAASGGFQLQPLTGTQSSAIVQIVAPQGDLTQAIFSDCPSITLAQTAPNLATLTLGNPRIDADITAAIIVGGDCATVTSSFVIPSNKQRPYYIPACVGTTRSSLTVSVFRYDSNNDLQPCGNTTNVTVDRQTFINTFSIPDSIQTNVTTQVVVDKSQIAIVQSDADLRGILADMMLAQIRTIVNIGLQLNASDYDNYQSLLNRIYQGTQDIADLMNRTRNTELYNYTSAFDSYYTNINKILEDQRKSINDSHKTLDDLGNKVFDAQSLAAEIANLTVRVNKAVNDFADALKAYVNADVAMARSVVTTLGQIKSNSLSFGDFFGGVGDLLRDGIGGAAGALVGGIGAVLDEAIKVGNAAFDMFERGLDKVLGIGVSAFQILFYGVIALVGCVVLFFIFKATGGGQFGKILSNELAISDLKANYAPPPPPPPQPTQQPTATPPTTTADKVSVAVDKVADAVKSAVATKGRVNQHMIGVADEMRASRGMKRAKRKGPYTAV